MTAKPDQTSARAHYESTGDHAGYVKLCEEMGWTVELPAVRNDPETGQAGFATPTDPKPTYGELVDWMIELGEFILDKFEIECMSECDFDATDTESLCRECESTGCIRWKFDRTIGLINKAKGA